MEGGGGGAAAAAPPPPLCSPQVPLQRRRGQVLRLRPAGLRVLRRGDDGTLRRRGGVALTPSGPPPFTHTRSVFQTKTYDSVTDKFMDFSFEKVRSPRARWDPPGPSRYPSRVVLRRHTAPTCSSTRGWSRRRRTARTSALTSLRTCWRYVHGWRSASTPAVLPSLLSLRLCPSVDLARQHAVPAGQEHL